VLREIKVQLEGVTTTLQLPLRIAHPLGLMDQNSNKSHLLQLQFLSLYPSKHLRYNPHRLNLINKPLRKKRKESKESNSLRLSKSRKD
jgi:hypothetical protein